MIYLASDHRGFEMKAKITEWLKEWGYEYEDMGPFEFDPQDDYPDFCSRVGEAVSKDPMNALGIVLGNSGQGEAMVVNKYKRVRAVVYYGHLPEMIKLTKEHNHANVLSLAATFITEDDAKKLIKEWIETPYTDESRHIRRIRKIEALEDSWSK